MTKKKQRVYARANAINPLEVFEKLIADGEALTKQVVRLRDSPNAPDVYQLKALASAIARYRIDIERFAEMVQDDQRSWDVDMPPFNEVINSMKGCIIDAMKSELLDNS